MSDHNKLLTLEELRQAVRDKESELSELELMLVDYHTERSHLFQELRRLQAQLRDADKKGEKKGI